MLVAVAACGSSSSTEGSGSLANTSASKTPAPTSTATAGSTPTTPATKKTTTKSAPTDCVTYDPSNVTVDGSGASGTFVVSSGSTVVMRLHGQDDMVGQQALALAQRYKEHCYIGRNNTRDPKGDYIFDYWLKPSGNTPEIPDEDDACRTYNNHNLTVENMGDGDGWRVKDHDDVLHVFDNGADANSADKILLKYTQICSIGETEDGDADLGAVTFSE
jgi:hypothetical protein